MATKLDRKFDALYAILPKCGFSQDTYGHYQKKIKDENGVVRSAIRVKIQSTSVRLELKLGSEWRKVDSAYLKDVVITEDSVTIGRKTFTMKG